MGMKGKNFHKKWKNNVSLVQLVLLLLLFLNVEWIYQSKEVNVGTTNMNITSYVGIKGQ
jgi:hypothetical protein